MRLRKVIVDVANLDCSSSVAAMLAEALEAAAALVESSGGLKSAAGAAPALQTLAVRKAADCMWRTIASSQRAICAAQMASLRCSTSEAIRLPA